MFTPTPPGGPFTHIRRQSFASQIRNSGVINEVFHAGCALEYRKDILHIQGRDRSIFLDPHLKVTDHHIPGFPVELFPSVKGYLDWPTYLLGGKDRQNVQAIMGKIGRIASFSKRTALIGCIDGNLVHRNIELFAEKQLVRVRLLNVHP